MRISFIEGNLPSRRRSATARRRRWKLAFPGQYCSVRISTHLPSCLRGSCWRRYRLYPEGRPTTVLAANDLAVRAIPLGDRVRIEAATSPIARPTVAAEAPRWPPASAGPRAAPCQSGQRLSRTRRVGVFQRLQALALHSSSLPGNPRSLLSTSFARRLTSADGVLRSTSRRAGPANSPEASRSCVACSRTTKASLSKLRTRRASRAAFGVSIGRNRRVRYGTNRADSSARAHTARRARGASCCTTPSTVRRDRLPACLWRRTL